VDCNGVQRLAGTAIDGFLANEVEKEFQIHLDHCKPCRDQIGMEMVSKRLVRTYVLWMPTPGSIRSRILASLHQEYGTTVSPDDDRDMALSGFRSLFLALAGGLVAAIFFFLVGISTDRSLAIAQHTAKNDMIHQSFETFAQVRAGLFVPAVVTSLPEGMEGFFQGSPLAFGVQVPWLRGCDWYAGSAFDNEGIGEAHLVYKTGREWVYVCEVKGDDALVGVQLTLPKAAKAALQQSGWYTDPMHPGCNVVLWKKNGVVCVAVSTMGKQQLLALLNSSHKPPH
jgi:hypothetical protein